ncbi:MAG: arginine deiminase family protein [Chromatiales bacterium]|nr:arginine deiminase family protein [Chromatiales bacterium]
MLCGERPSALPGPGAVAGPGPTPSPSRPGQDRQCTTATPIPSEALTKAGFAVPTGRGLHPRCSAKAEDFGRLVVGFDGIELARGGGGARCMTCPVEREDL